MAEMRKSIKYVILSVFLSSLIGSCGGLKSEQTEMSSDSVTVNMVDVTDTISYILSNKSQCSVMAEAKIAYPDAYKDKAETEKLQQLFSDIVLDVPSDSIGLNGAFSKFVKNVLGQFGEDSDGAKFEDDDREVVYKYNSMTNISVVYNKDGFLTFCKEEVTKKNDVVTMVSHNYYNISLEKMAKIELNNIFSEENISDISDLLKRKLLVQLHAKDEAEIIDMGYFNLDNLVANNNFRIGENGITWTFGTFEIACYSVGETNITLDYDALKPYMLENSEVQKYVQ